MLAASVLVILAFLYFLFWTHKFYASKEEAAERITNYFDKNIVIKSNNNIDAKGDGLIGTANTFDQAIDQLYKIARIDDRVIEAVNFSSSGSPSIFESGNALSHISEGSGAWERLKGYVGEQVVADILSKQGYVVEIADSPAQVGYDLLIDGNKYQVKTTLSTSYVQEHLDKYPDIPVIVPEELQTSILSGNDNVIFLPQFSHDAVNDITTTGLEELGEIGDFSPSVHIPLITMCVIGCREYEKVKDNGKDVLEGLKDTVFETTGTATGGIVGRSVGAVVGGALGPFGAFAVGLVGAFGGAALGKYLVKKWRLRSILEAKDELYKSIASCAEELSRSLRARCSALRRKKSMLNYNPFLLIYPTPELLSKRALVQLYNIEIRNINKAISELNTPIPDSPESTDKDKVLWANKMLLIIYQNPVINKPLDEKKENLQLRMQELNDLLKRRGLLS